jgi:hypothetical protein
MTCLSTFGVPACINGTTSVTAVFGVDRQGDASVHYLDKNGAPVTVIPADTVAFGGCTPATAPTQRIHENFVITGTTPLVIPAGVFSISVTKTSTIGVVNINGNNGTDFPLTFNRENFSDSINEEVSTLSAYTITGTLAGSSYKVHIIR